ncbi:MAG: uroporphyrinogen decarboxylase [Bacteroidota bacterium]|jgi:uroporphyrinogen decarboxylase
MKNFKRNAFINTLRGTSDGSEIPVWMMRQAGRYLPGYQVLKAKYGFFERCQTPELATEITVMPIYEMPIDAAILFSDILVVPQAMGLEVLMEEGKGPLLPSPIRNAADLARVCVPDVYDRLHYVADAVKLTVKTLDSLVPLIGFAGAPWTIFCYMVEGKGSKGFDLAKSFCFAQPELSHKLLQMITDTTIAYLKMKVEAGVDCIQLFDSWGGMLGPEDYNTISLPYIRQIVEALQPHIPVTIYAKGVWYGLGAMAATGATTLGIDWCTSPEFARNATEGKVILQGNFDPAALLAPIPEIQRRVKDMVSRFDRTKYIANLGHGILPNIPVDHARAFVEAVKVA